MEIAEIDNIREKRQTLFHPYRTAGKPTETPLSLGTLEENPNYTENFNVVACDNSIYNERDKISNSDATNEPWET